MHLHLVVPLLKKHLYNYTKSVRIRNFSAPYFPAFGLIRTRKTLNTDTFHAVYSKTHCIIELRINKDQAIFASYRMQFFRIFEVFRMTLCKKQYRQLSGTPHVEKGFRFQVHDELNE